MTARALTLLGSLALALAACDAADHEAPGDAGITLDAGSATATTIDTQEELARSAASLPSVLMTDLVIGGAGSDLEQVVLPGITEVRGNIFVLWTDRLTHVALPNLTRAGKLTVTGNAALQALELPRLEQLERLVLHLNDALLELGLPSLARMQELEIDANPALTRVEMPQFQGGTVAERPPWLAIRQNARLGRASFPALTAAQALEIESNYALRQLDLNALERLLGEPDLSGRGTRIENNDHIELLRFPALVAVTGRLWVTERALSALELPVLTQLGDLFLWEAALLRSLVLPQLARVQSLYVGDVERLDAPVLEELGDFDFSRPRQLSLPKLTRGCKELTSVFKLPDCAVASVVPSCPPYELSLKRSCTCSPDNDLMAAHCPGDIILPAVNSP